MFQFATNVSKSIFGELHILKEYRNATDKNKNFLRV